MASEAACSVNFDKSSDVWFASMGEVNCKVRDITEDGIKDKNGVMSGPPGLLKLVEEAEKVLSY